MYGSISNDKKVHVAAGNIKIFYAEPDYPATLI
jgi:hypothetical protein